MTRHTLLAALAAAALAAPAAAQGICEYQLEPGAAPIPGPGALFNVEGVVEALAGMPAETVDLDAFAAVTVMFDQGGRAEELEVFLRPGVTGDAAALQRTLRELMIPRAPGPRGKTAVMTLERGTRAGITPIAPNQECMPRLVNFNTVHEDLTRNLDRWINHQMNNGGRQMFNTDAVLRFRVDERGRIGRVRLVERTNAPEVDQIFRRSVQRGVYEPGSVRGIPIARWLELPMGIFVLR
jgi:hypothetical protein